MWTKIHQVLRVDIYFHAVRAKKKTLSSLALVFALHAFKPTPLYFMDEIDAVCFDDCFAILSQLWQRLQLIFMSHLSIL
jgi:hypothetical protein